MNKRKDVPMSKEERLKLRRERRKKRRAVVDIDLCKQDGKFFEGQHVKILSGEYKETIATIARKADKPNRWQVTIKGVGCFTFREKKLEATEENMATKILNPIIIESVEGEVICKQCTSTGKPEDISLCACGDDICPGRPKFKRYCRSRKACGLCGKYKCIACERIEHECIKCKVTCAICRPKGWETCENCERELCSECGYFDKHKCGFRICGDCVVNCRKCKIKEIYEKALNPDKEVPKKLDFTLPKSAASVGYEPAAHLVAGSKEAREAKKAKIEAKIAWEKERDARIARGEEPPRMPKDMDPLGYGTEVKGSKVSFDDFAVVTDKVADEEMRSSQPEKAKEAQKEAEAIKKAYEESEEGLALAKKEAETTKRRARHEAMKQAKLLEQQQMERDAREKTPPNQA